MPDGNSHPEGYRGNHPGKLPRFLSEQLSDNYPDSDWNSPLLVITYRDSFSVSDRNSFLGSYRGSYLK